MINELSDKFPNITERKVWRILLTIKFRYMKYGTIGISRLESVRFWISERQLQKFIKYLRDIKAIKKVKSRFTQNWFKCNVYSVFKWFSEWLKEVREYVKKKFEYIDALDYVKGKFATKKEWSKIKFKVNWDRYIIHTRWKFKNVIYDVWNNCIINPLNLFKPV